MPENYLFINCITTSCCDSHYTLLRGNSQKHVFALIAKYLIALKYNINELCNGRCKALIIHGANLRVFFFVRSNHSKNVTNIITML